MVFCFFHLWFFFHIDKNKKNMSRTKYLHILLIIAVKQSFSPSVLPLKLYYLRCVHFLLIHSQQCRDLHGSLSGVCTFLCLVFSQAKSALSCIPRKKVWLSIARQVCGTCSDFLHGFGTTDSWQQQIAMPVSTLALVETDTLICFKSKKMKTKSQTAFLWLRHRAIDCFM